MATTPDVGKASNHIAGDFRMLAEHAEELLRATTSATSENVRMAREHLDSSLHNARRHLEDAHAQAAERARAAIASATTYARERPYQVIAAAVLLGATVGLLSALRRRRD